jgi:ubiquinone/menaquinone biosynthesis C-methylase UbiE
MKRNGTHAPTVEDAIELSGIEMLHPGGISLTRRTAEVARMRPGLQVLDVSSGRGTQAIYYAQETGVEVTGVDISEQMVRSASRNALRAGVSDRVHFQWGDSQRLPFPDSRFDAVVNECAVGIPENSQAVLDEMLRVVKPGGLVVIHESTWRKSATDEEKEEELAERYGTTPLEHDQWISMLQRAGVTDLQSELEPWSRPEMFWNVRRDRTVRHPSRILGPWERLLAVRRLARRYGLQGVWKAFRNEKALVDAVRSGKLGYGLYWGRRPFPLQ